MNWELIGKLGGGEGAKAEPFEVKYDTDSVSDDRAILRVRGEPDTEYLAVLEGQYENGASSNLDQLGLRTGGSDWTQLDSNGRGKIQWYVALARDGDIIEVRRNNTWGDSSFEGTAYLIPKQAVPEEDVIAEEYKIENLAMSGAGDTEHPLVEIEVPDGEFWRVRVHGVITYEEGFISQRDSPVVRIGASDFDRVIFDREFTHDGLVKRVNPTVAVTTNYSGPVIFSGTVTITKPR